MELPPSLRLGVERLLAGTPLAALREASALLSARYRAERRDGRLHLDGELAVKAYLAARLPATYAAVRSALEMVAVARPGFMPSSLLDLGAGPGTALWAAADCWSGLEAATLVEASAAARDAGRTLSGTLASPSCDWRQADLARLPALAPAELVTLTYVLDELDPALIPDLADRSWALTRDTLVIVEPGTPAGWRRILRVRDRLLAHGAHLVAPCPHERPCPLAAPDWCHFAARVARSRIHKDAKSAKLAWEDEKYIFVAASRHPPSVAGARVLAPARHGSGVSQVKLCRVDGSAGAETFSRRQGERYRIVRRLDWGDLLEQ